MSKKSVKLIAISMALPIGYICGFAPQLISVWVGKEYMYLSPLLILLISHFPINLSVLPLFSINVAHKRVCIPGLVTMFMGLGSIILSIILSNITDLGYYSVALSAAIMLTTKNAIFTPLYVAKVLDVSYATYYKEILLGIMYTFFVAVISYASSNIITAFKIMPLIIIGIIIGVTYFIVIWVIGLNDSEKNILKSFISKSINYS